MQDKPARAILRKGRDRLIAKGHPWVFSGAVADVEGSRAPGTVVDVVSRERWLGRGLLNPDCELCIRIFSRRREEALDAGALCARARAAAARRERIVPADADTDAWRVVYSEADGLSGLVVDRYGDLLSARVSARVLVPYLEALRDTLLEATGTSRWLAAADPAAIVREKMDAGAVAATSTVEAGPVRIRQDGLRFEVDPRGGHKTGFYLDQRVNRKRVASYAAGARMLSVYCYTGAFEVYAAAAGAGEITGMDESIEALDQARAHHALNTLSVPADYEPGNAPALLRRYRDAGRAFDLIVLDPPRFVARRDQLEKGLRAYKDINLLAMKLLTPEGILATFSCSGLVSRTDFTRAVAWAATDAGRNVRILETLGQPADHPVLISFPESEYLKGLICCVE